MASTTFAKVSSYNFLPVVELLISDPPPTSFLSKDLNTTFCSLVEPTIKIIYDYPSCLKYAKYAVGTLTSGWFGSNSSGIYFTGAPLFDTSTVGPITNVSGEALYSFCDYVNMQATDLDPLFQRLSCDGT